MNNQARKKLTNLNIIRVLCALFVFLYHAYHNMACRYGFLDPIVSQSVYFMTAFFLLSGFILYYNYEDRDTLSRDQLGIFYTRRLERLYPLYFLVWIVFFIRLWATPVTRDIFTFPFQALLLQNAPGHYSYQTNGGTWFLSCIMFCYLFAPFLIHVIRLSSRREALIALAVVFSLLCGAPTLYVWYRLNIFNNAVVRLIEFSFGMLLCRLFLDRERPFRRTESRSPAILASVLLLLSLFLVRFLRTRFPVFTNCPDCLTPFNVICVGLVLILYSCGGDFFGPRMQALIAFLSRYSLEFWIATFFSTEIYRKYLLARVQTLAHPNRAGVALTLLLNLAVTALLAFYTKGVKKLGAKYKPPRLLFAALGCMILLIAVKLVMTVL